MARKSPPVVTGKKTSKSCPKPFQTITHSVPSASVIFEILKVSITVLQTRIPLLTFLPNQVLLLLLTRNLGLLIQPPLIAFEAFVLSHCCETLQISEKLCLTQIFIATFWFTNLQLTCCCFCSCSHCQITKPMMRAWIKAAQAYIRQCPADLLSPMACYCCSRLDAGIELPQLVPLLLPTLPLPRTSCTCLTQAPCENRPGLRSRTLTVGTWWCLCSKLKLNSYNYPKLLLSKSTTFTIAQFN